MVGKMFLVFMVLGVLSFFSYSNPYAVKYHSDKYVLETVDWINSEGINCAQPFSHEMCKTINVSFNEGVFDASRVDDRQTILILDSGMNLSSVLRYRSRIKAHFIYDYNSKSFIQSNPEVAISKLGKKLLTEIDNFHYFDTEVWQNRPGFLASAWLQDLASAYRSAAPSDVNDSVTGNPHFSHGSKVIGYLAQHNPKAEFVLIDTDSFLPFIQHKKLTCEKKYNKFLSYMNSAAESLQRDVINRYGVEYINYSGGFERSHIYKAWNRNGCSGHLNNRQAKKLLDLLKPIYSVLFESPNTLGIQAGVPNAQPSENSLDLIDYANRIRVQPYTTNSLDTSISEYGYTGWQEIFRGFRGQFSNSYSIDMYVNFGYNPDEFFVTNRTPKMTSGIFGMRYAPDFSLITSSWAAPVVTSYAIHTQSKIFNSNPYSTFDPYFLKEKLLSSYCGDSEGDQSSDLLKFIGDGGSRCRIHDPLKYRSDELNRLGYLFD